MVRGRLILLEPPGLNPVPKRYHREMLASPLPNPLQPHTTLSSALIISLCHSFSPIMSPARRPDKSTRQQAERYEEPGVTLSIWYSKLLVVVFFSQVFISDLCSYMEVSGFQLGLSSLGCQARVFSLVVQ